MFGVRCNLCITIPFRCCVLSVLFLVAHVMSSQCIGVFLCATVLFHGHCFRDYYLHCCVQEKEKNEKEKKEKIESYLLGLPLPKYNKAPRATKNTNKATDLSSVVNSTKGIFMIYVYILLSCGFGGIRSKNHKERRPAPTTIRPQPIHLPAFVISFHNIQFQTLTDF